MYWIVLQADLIFTCQVALEELAGEVFLRMVQAAGAGMAVEGEMDIIMAVLLLVALHMAMHSFHVSLEVVVETVVSMV